MNTMTVLKLVSSEPQVQAPSVSGTDVVTIEALAKLVGFPSESIKKELLLEGDQLSMTELRSTVLKFLQKSLAE